MNQKDHIMKWLHDVERRTTRIQKELFRMQEDSMWALYIAVAALILSGTSVILFFFK